ncbi:MULTISPECIES: helix-turn-helix domain-containing protein [unclassified Frankia]|uniref:helix-turn-helix domain-containing protein n=1 Tax=unclassified Frankia TaxID=2632575 RepID=UPI001EF6701D|nr:MULTISPECIES: helix-turn-helix domain-containing protein [unclassified Frankia]
MRGEAPTTADREEISHGITEGLSGPAMVRRLGKNRSMVYREIHRCGGRGKYRAVDAQQRTEEQTRRPKPRKLAVFRRLHDAVADGLVQK